MRTDEIVMAVLLKGGRKMLTGESLLHNTIYILNEKIDLGLDFRPCYYGPHSIEIANAIDCLRSSKILTEYSTNVPFCDVKDWIESRRNIYLLTEVGTKIAKRLEIIYPDTIKGIKYQLAKIEKIDGLYDYENLSIAAKIHQLYKNEDKKPSVDEIIKDIHFLKWNVSYPSRITNFLIQMELEKWT